MVSKIGLDVRTMYFIFLSGKNWKGFDEKQRCRDIGTRIKQFTFDKIAEQLLREMLDGPTSC